MTHPRIIPINPKTTWRDVFFILFRQKTKLVLTFLLIFSAVTVSTLLSPSIYRAQAKILFKIGRESLASDPTLTAINPILSVGQSRDAEIQSEIEILTSEELAAYVVNRFGPRCFLEPGYADSGDSEDGFTDRMAMAFQGNAADPLKQGESRPSADPEERERAVRTLSKNLLVNVSNKSNIVTISIDAYAPNLAKQILENLLEVFAYKHIQVHRNKGSLRFFKDEAAKQKRALESAENDLKAMKMRSGVGDVGEHVVIVMERIKNLRGDIAETESSLAAAQAMLVSLEATVARIPDKIMTQEKSGVANMASDAMREKLFDLRLKEQYLSSRYEDGAPPLVVIRQEIASAQAALSGEDLTRTEATQGINEVRQKAMARIHEERATVAALQARQESLKMQVARANAELRRTTALQTKMQQLERDIGIMRENYLRYVEKTEQARISSALEHENISNISIVQAPFAPTEPIAPARMLNIGVGLLLALFGSFGFAYLAEHQDHTLKKPEEIEHLLDVPVLASISNIPVAKGEEDSNPAIVARNGGGWEIPRATRMAVKILRDSACTGKLCHGMGTMFLLTSTQRREGVTTIAMNLAFSLTADGDERVLLVDANTPNPVIHKLFGLTGAPGLCGLLLDKDLQEKDVIRPSGIENLDVLPAGGFNHEASMITESKLFESCRFGEILENWRGRYHYIVFDAPPLSANSGALRLSSYADAAIWIIEAEAVHRHSAYYSKELLRQAEAPLLGSVLNRRRFYVPRWLYGK